MGGKKQTKGKKGKKGKKETAPESIPIEKSEECKPDGDAAGCKPEQPKKGSKQTKKDQKQSKKGPKPTKKDPKPPKTGGKSQ